MIELLLVPPTGTVARITLTPVPAPVFIIISMTGNTICIQFLLYTCRMAGRALNLAMSACKREIRPGMIELHIGPVPFAVALITFRPVAADMYVIKLVAAIAICRCIFISLTDMTAVAIQICMPSRQTKIRFVMIEFLITPAALIVAIRTVIAELFFVNVIFCMTINTFSRAVAVFLSAGMAGATADTGVRSL